MLSIRDFEKFALGLLESFYAADAARSKKFILRKNAYYEYTSMQAAVISNSIEIIAHPCFQDLIMDIWYDIVLKNNSTQKVLFRSILFKLFSLIKFSKKLFAAIILPFLAPILLEFKKKELKIAVKNDEESRRSIEENTEDLNMEN